MEELGMKKQFEIYDQTRASFSGFTKAELEAGKHPKIKEIKEIIELAQSNLMKRFGDKYQFNFTETSSSVENLSEKYVEASFEKQKGIASDTPQGDSNSKITFDVFTNYNFSKLGMLKSEEMYAVVYGNLYKRFLEKRSEYEKTSEGDQLLKVTELEDGKESSGADKTAKDNSKGPISRYLKELLKKLLGIEENEDVYENAAQEIEKDFLSSGIKAEDMFEEPNRSGSSLFEQRFEKVAKLGYTQQASFLLAEIEKDKFKELNSDDDEKIKEFCNKYIDVYNEQNNLNVGVSFEDKGGLGGYNRGNNTININLDKIKKLKKPAEIVMTLSHELTHAIDRNSGARFGDVGNSKSEIKDIYKNGEKQEVINFIEKLQTICYRVNVNERSGRIGELAALEFMRGMIDPNDAEMTGYFDASYRAFIKYQKDVYSNIKYLNNGGIEYLADEANKYLNDSSVSERSKTLIRKRRDYLKGLKLDPTALDPTAEEKSIKDAEEIMKKFKNGQTAEVTKEEMKEMGDD